VLGRQFPRSANLPLVGSDAGSYLWRVIGKMIDRGPHGRAATRNVDARMSV
jgi:hypothetical protein